jgi:hypothetical protein
MSDILYITGADRHMFNSTCCLLASFRHRLPGHRLWVADFGLLPAQRELLADLDVLLEMPPQVRGQFPPDMAFDRPELGAALYCKASLLEYVRDRAFDALLWIDADMMVTGDLAPAAEQLYSSLKEKNCHFAAAPALPRNTLGGLVEAYANNADCSAAPFGQRLAELGLDPDRPYINSGFFMATDRDALAQWRYLTCSTPRHVLFEQNAFNLVLYLRPEKFESLDVARWNLNNYMLGETETTIANAFPAVRFGETQVLLVHATSNRGDDYFRGERVIVDGDREMAFAMKFFNRPELRVLQEFYLRDFLAYAGDKAVDAGLATVKTRASA